LRNTEILIRADKFRLLKDDEWRRLMPTLRVLHDCHDQDFYLLVKTLWELGEVVGISAGLLPSSKDQVISLKKAQAVENL